MADREFKATGNAAYREMWAHVAEAQALVILLERSEDTDGTACLVRSTVTRLCDAIDGFEAELRAGGWTLEPTS